MKDLKEFETATNLPQDSNRILLKVRAVFDSLVENCPNMHHYISSDSRFVHSPAFENGIVEVYLKELLDPFLQSNISNVVSPTKPTSLSVQALNRIKRRKIATCLPTSESTA